MDSSRNMARFYRLSIQPTLFGGSSLVRNWGRIGTEGRLKVELFETLGQAAVARERVASRKLGPGYRHENAARRLVALSRSQQQPVLNRQTVVE
nr:WGR domain-containing protein [Rhizobium sp. R339]